MVSMQTIVARIAMERKLKMKIEQAATTVPTNTIKAEKIYAALPEGHIWSFSPINQASNSSDFWKMFMVRLYSFGYKNQMNYKKYGSPLVDSYVGLSNRIERFSGGANQAAISPVILTHAGCASLNCLSERLVTNQVSD
jgi:hypothetical protein